MKIDFLILESFQIPRTGIRALITGHFPGATIIEADTERKALALLSENRFDVAIFSSFFGNQYSASLCKSIKKSNPELTMILFGNNNNIYSCKGYLRAGVKGCININEEPNEEIGRSIAYVLAGNTYVSNTFKNQVAEARSTRGRYGNPFHTLSKREKQVVELLFLGKKMNQIAEFLEVRNTTVSTYKTRLFTKLNIPDQSLIKLVSLARIHNVIA